jgi:hypothetical protein
MDCRILGAVAVVLTCQPSQHPSTVAERGWEREVDRHQRIAERIRGLVTELGEPSDPPGGERDLESSRGGSYHYIGSHACPIRTVPARR